MNEQDPFPWSDKSKLIPKAIAYYSGVSATTSGWLKPGQKFGYNGCWSNIGFQYGVEASNAEEIYVKESNGSTGLAVAGRWRDVSCPAGSQATRQGCITSGPPPKDMGCHDASSQVGDPCDAGTGNEFQFDSDYSGPSGTLSFTRAYNSLDTEDHDLGYGWTASFDKRLDISGNTLTVYKDDGSGEPFTQTNGVWQGDADTKLELNQDGTGYTVRQQDGSSERYNLDGRLLSETDRSGRTTTYIYDSNGHVATVTGPFDHSLHFTYDGNGRLASLTDPSGNVTQYSYDSNGNLSQVTYPDGSAKRYSYGNTAYPHALTAVAYVDSAGNVRPYASFGYDSNGKVVTNTLAGGQEHFDLNYDSATQTTVTDAGGRQDVLTFTKQLDVTKLLSRITQSDGKGLSQQFDDRNNLVSRTDADGHTTTYTYDAQNRLTSRTAAAGTPQARTVSYQYGTDGLALPVEIDRPSVCSGSTQKTLISYDANHNPTQITETGYTPSCTSISRSMSLSYNAAGQVTRIDGPRTDVSDITTLAYNDCTAGGACGQLQSTTDALGHTTTFDSYDAAGRLLRKTDPNGLVTRYSYDGRGRVASIVEQPPSGASRTTTFRYTAADKLAQVTLPDGRSLSYQYNDAQELTGVTDNLGDKIAYGYDSRGNRTQTSTYDPDGTLVRQVKRVYDIRDHLASINDGGDITQRVNDALGNLLQQTDPDNNPPTSHSYDPLNRLIKTVDAIGGVTSYSYDPNGQVDQVVTPNGATTRYQYDDFGDKLQEVSPDRGSTTYQYDAAGNLINKTDARGVTASYSYDALNRLTAIHYSGLTTHGGPGGSGSHGRIGNDTLPSADVSLTYDSGQGCSNGTGRLCSAKDQSGTTTYAYDAFGNILSQTHLSDTAGHGHGGWHLGRHDNGTTVSYRYDSGNRMVAIVYPDGREVDYQRDALGRIQAITTTANGHSQTLVSDRRYRSDGSLTGQTFGNGLTDQRQYTAQGRLSSWMLGGKRMSLGYDYRYDANGNLTGQDGPDGSAAYQYDPLDRLTDEDWGSGNYHNAYSYDGNGNRLTSLTDRGKTLDYGYDPQSNRLNQKGKQTVTLDAAGNTTDDGRYQYRYDAAGRLSEVLWHGMVLARYRYDYRGLRRQKTTMTGTTEFAYGPNGHLLSEQGALGANGRDYVWSDTSPIAQIDARGISHRGDQIDYLHSDAMGTPRLATNDKQQIVWKWSWDAFGDSQVIRGRDAHSRIEMNLRYPGQYYDSETGLFYNWHRYYDPSTGRYGRSDPVGLEGGTNSYAYAINNPLQKMDMTGRATEAALGLCVLGGPENPACDAAIVVNVCKWLGIGVSMGMASAILSEDKGAMPSSSTQCSNPGPSCKNGGKDPCKGLRNQLEEHERKLKQYLENPDLVDNKGFLAKAPAERRAQIINGRIRNLEKQIENFRRQLAECERKHGMK